MLLKMKNPVRKEREKGERKGIESEKGEEGINYSQLGCHDKKPKFICVRPLGQDYGNKTRVQNLPKGLD